MGNQQQRPDQQAQPGGREFDQGRDKQHGMSEDEKKKYMQGGTPQPKTER